MLKALKQRRVDELRTRDVRAEILLFNASGVADGNRMNAKLSKRREHA